MMLRMFSNKPVNKNTWKNKANTYFYVVLIDYLLKELCQVIENKTNRYYLSCFRFLEMELTINLLEVTYWMRMNGEY